MLRARSGGSGPDRPADRDAELASIVAAAQAELDRAIQVGGLQNDPLRHTVHALSVHLIALHKVLLGFGAEVDAARQLVRDDILRVGTPQSTAVEIPATTSKLRDALLVAALLVAALLIGAGAGYWFRGAVPFVVGMHAAPEKCDDRPDGSRLCWIPVWERMPAGR